MILHLRNCRQQFSSSAHVKTLDVSEIVVECSQAYSFIMLLLPFNFYEFLPLCQYFWNKKHMAVYLHQ